MKQVEQRPSLVLGLIGSGIQASLTPARHEREGEAQGLRVIYRLIGLDRLGPGPDSLDKLLTAAESMGFSGSTSPFPASRPSSRCCMSFRRMPRPWAP